MENHENNQNVEISQYVNELFQIEYNYIKYLTKEKWKTLTEYGKKRFPISNDNPEMEQFYSSNTRSHQLFMMISHLLHSDEICFNTLKTDDYLIYKNLTTCVNNPYQENSNMDLTKLYQLSYENMCLCDDVVDMKKNSIKNKLLDSEAVYMEIHGQHIINERIEDLTNFDNDIKAYILYLFINGFEIKKNVISLMKLFHNTIMNRNCDCVLLNMPTVYEMLNVSYGDPETKRTIMQTILQAELDAQYDLTITRGTFPLWNRNDEYEIEETTRTVTLPLNDHDLTQFDMMGVELKGKTPFFKQLYNQFPHETKRMFIHGRRNSTWANNNY